MCTQEAVTAVAALVQRLADLSPVICLRFKNKMLLCSGTSSVFHYLIILIFHKMERQQKVPFGMKILSFLHSSWPPYVFSTACSLLSLLLWLKVSMAILAAGGLTLCVPLTSTLSEGFLGETVAQCWPGFSLFMDEPIRCHFNSQPVSYTLSTQTAIFPLIRINFVGILAGSFCLVVFSIS